MYVFSGEVTTGLGRHSDLQIPGRATLDAAPQDWPETFFPGSLNVKIDQFADCLNKKKQNPLAALDGGIIACCFVIPQHKIANNSLTPKRHKPLRGTAQIWRAKLLYEEQGFYCWVMRRIGSHMHDTLELISEHPIRKKLGLTTEQSWPVRVLMFEGNTKAE